MPIYELIKSWVIVSSHKTHHFRATAAHSVMTLRKLETNIYIRNKHGCMAASVCDALTSATDILKYMLLSFAIR